MEDKDDLPSIDDLSKSIEDAKARNGEKKVESDSPGARALRTSVDLLAGVVVGSVIGYYLDKWLDTLPVFFLICFFLGVAGAGLNIYRSVVRDNNNDNDE